MDDAFGPMAVLEMPDLGQFAVARLERFARLAAESSGQESEQRLARWAAYAAFRDCCALGLQREGAAALRRAQHSGPNAEVSVRREYLLALCDTTNTARRLLAGLTTGAAEADAWCPRGAVLEVLQELDAHGLHGTVRLCGASLAGQLRGDFRASGAQDFAGVVERLAALHADMHRGDHSDVVTARVERGASGHGRALVTCHDAYPCEFWRGWFEGAAACFGQSVLVIHADGPCKVVGDPTCCYELVW
jgi:hypothetical protein